MAVKIGGLAHVTVMRLRWMTIAVGVALAVFLLCTYPLYFVYACVGIGIAFALRLLGRWLRRLFEPWPGVRVLIGEQVCSILLAVLLLFSLMLLSVAPVELKIGVVIALVGIAVWQFPRFRSSKKLQRISLVPAVLLPLFLFFLASMQMGFKVGAPSSERVVYTGVMRLKADHLLVKNVVAVPEDSVRGFDNLENGYEQIKLALEKCGWKEDIEFNFSMNSEQPLSSRWIPFKTVNNISFPPMACGTLLLSAKQESTMTVVAPRYVVGKTDPEAKSRTEALTGGTETIVIPVESSWDRPLSLQLQIISPILRNAVGNYLLGGAGWEPLKWVLLAICGIFSEQIKKSLLVPFSRWVFKLLHIPFKENEAAPSDG